MSLTRVSSSFSQTLRDYGVLVKFKLNLLVVFSAATGYLMAPYGEFRPSQLAFLCLGGFLVTGASNALNQIFEKELDSLMPRTAKRPVAQGRISVTQASLLAGLMSIIGLVILASFNLLTALLGALSLLSYVFVYTPMKRISPIAVLIGAFPGAFPTLIGWVAVTGSISVNAFALFGIQFLWQFPHFWAIAWKSYEDYAKAGFYLLPNGRKDKNSALQIVLYCLFLVVTGIFPYLLGLTGLASMLVVGVAALYFTYTAVNLYKYQTDKAALSVMFASFFYLPIVQVALLIDKL